MQKIDLSSFLPREKYTINDAISDSVSKAHVAMLNDEEKKKLNSLIALIQKDFPEDSKDHFYLIRVLKARKWDVAAAEKMFRKRMVR